MKIIAYLCGVSVAFIAVYFMSVLSKEVSYRIFYEDKVKETIREMVKTESLKKINFEE